MKFNQINLGIVSVFLIKSKDGYILVDTGLSSSYKTITKKLEKNGLTLLEITHIIITHHHYDHVGLLAKILRENNHIKLIIHEKEVKAISKGKTIIGETSLITKPFMFIKNRAKLKYTDFESVFIKEGDIIVEDDIYSLKKMGLDAKIIYTPGHTSGSISILFDNGDVIVGDLIINLKLLKGFKPFVADNYSQIIDSIKKLKEMGAKILYPSHGSSVDIDEVLKNPFK